MWTVLIFPDSSKSVSSIKFEDQPAMNSFMSTLNWDDISMISINNDGIEED